MNIRFACQECGKEYKVSSQFAGKMVKCKKCGNKVRVPTEPEKVSKREKATSARSSPKPAGGSSSSSTSTRGSAEKKRSKRLSKRSKSASEDEAPVASKKRVKAKMAPPGAETIAVPIPDISKEMKLYERKKKDDKVMPRGTGRLVLFVDGKASKSYRLDGKAVVIGRAKGAGVKLEDASVSNEHVKLELRLGKFTATDLKSRNGLVVNGRKLRRASLKSGDVIQLGTATLRIDCG